MILSIDIGGTAVKMGLIDREGTIHARHEASVCYDNYHTPILTTVIREAKAFLAQQNAVIEGVGVSATGQVDDREGVVIGTNGKIPHYEGSPIKREMEREFGVPAFALNDANAAALGECFAGRAKGVENVLMITLGTGVGGGIILDGSMVFGMSGLGGEIGHVVVNPDETTPCNCGQYGCLDQTASATGIVRAAKRLLDESADDSSLRALETITARDVVDAARHGDALAEKAFDRCMYFLGKSMAMLTNILDPDVYIIGGGVSKAGDYLVDTVKKHYEALATLSERRADIVLAKLGNDAGIYGAAKLAMDSAR